MQSSSPYQWPACVNLYSYYSGSITFRLQMQLLQSALYLHQPTSKWIGLRLKPALHCLTLVVILPMASSLMMGIGWVLKPSFLLTKKQLLCLLRKGCKQSCCESPVFLLDLKHRQWTRYFVPHYQQRYAGGAFVGRNKLHTLGWDIAI